MTRKKIADVRSTVPESLSTLLTQIRTVIFNVDRVQFARDLAETKREPIQTSINRNAIKDIEERRRVLNFEHIENYSRLMGLPTAALVFVSRYQRSPIEEAELVASVLLETVKNARSEGRSRLTASDLLRVAHQINLSVANKPELPPLSATSRIDAESQRQHREGRGGDDDLPLFKPGDPSKDD